MSTVVDDPETSKKRVNVKQDYISQFKKLIETLKASPKKVAIFTHTVPDPDALGSQMGLAWLLKKLDIEVDCFVTGEISNPQNLTLVNLLEPQCLPIDRYCSDEYQANVIVDAIPDGGNAGVGDLKLKFDLVLDHHKVVPNGGFKGLFVNLQNGSCCSTIYNLIKALDITFDDDNDQDSRVATALLVGIATDTNNMMSSDTTDHEFVAFKELFPFRKQDALTDIINWRLPKFWFNRSAEAQQRAVIGDDGVAVVCLEELTATQQGLVAHVADEIIRVQSVEVAVCFAIVDGQRIVGCVRSNNASLNVNDLSARLGGNNPLFGSGGGKLGKGGYCRVISGCEIVDGVEDTIKDEMLTAINHMETARIHNLIRR